MPSRFFSEDDLQKGERLCKEGRVGEIIFSGGTYQVEVKEGRKQFWPFLQISDEGQLKDHLCSCHGSEASSFCAHQAAAWIKIFNGKHVVLHLRFQQSFWYQIFQLAARRQGYETSFFKKSSDSLLEASSSTGRLLFSIKAHTAQGKKLIKELVIKRKRETEETSIKFSNLSPEELLLWKEGRPSPELSFELSFWSDLAKWCFQQQEEKSKYQLVFDANGIDLPKYLNLDFKDLSFSFYIAETYWPSLIPTLTNIESPLKVHQISTENIREIVYDSIEQAFHLDIYFPTPMERGTGQKQIGSWIYIPQEGFYPSHVDPLLKQKKISASQIPEFLKRHHLLIQKSIKHTKIHEKSRTARYQLYFDKSHDLHLVCYLYEKDDLKKPGAAKFGPWVFLPDKGFFYLENTLFDDIETIIPERDVAAFVTRHKHWLQSYEGFQTHLVSIEPKLTYQFSKGVLQFSAEIHFSEAFDETIDFQQWVYVKSRGFYPKDRSRTNSLLKPGLTVYQKDLNRFIRNYREELETVPGFFEAVSPVTGSGLKMELNKDQQIVVSPHYTLKEGFDVSKVQFFEDYTYVEGHGFCEIPSSLKLPAPYFEEQTVSREAEPYFVAYEMDLLKKYLLYVDPRLQKPEQLELQLRSFSKQIDGTWLVELVYYTPIGSLAAFHVWKALNEGRKYLFSDAGILFLTTPRYNWLRNLSKKKWMDQGKQLLLTTLEWIRLFAFEQLVPTSSDNAELVWKQFLETDVQDTPVTQGLKSELRSYQKVGLQWLWFLYSYGLSGLLCDEMGLGKTHQAMALLAAVIQVNPSAKFLVVCPTSVIFHWQDLLAKYLPILRVSVYYGAQRTLEDFSSQFDLLLTSYGTLRSQKDEIQEIPFQVAIFDEIQAAKNRLSQTHQVLKKLHVMTKIGLTGTPIENNLLELKALFDIVLPGYMPTDTVYKELFVNPIEKQHDAERKQLLARLIQPFILRRKKTEVLLELPEKVETLAYAPLSEEQRELYQKVYSESRDALLKELSDDGAPMPYLHVFALLTKLKQICNHPALYLSDLTHYQDHASGKWDLFLQLLEETRASGQKLVVFSQYLGMLDIMQHYFKEKKIGFAEIRGSTKHRKEEVERFKEDPECEVFIGSIQAAGVGIDLISASVVIHYDRWWNPAKENQATDRVHRMGQNRGVQVFKMITRGTLEEYIDELIEKKKSYVEDIVGYDEQDAVKSLSRQEIIHLMQKMDEMSF